MQLLKQNLEDTDREITEIEPTEPPQTRGQLIDLAIEESRDGTKLIVIGTSLDSLTDTEKVVNVIAVKNALVLCNLPTNPSS